MVMMIDADGGVGDDDDDDDGDDGDDDDDDVGVMSGSVGVVSVSVL